MNPKENDWPANHARPPPRLDSTRAPISKNHSDEVKEVELTAYCFEATATNASTAGGGVQHGGLPQPCWTRSPPAPPTPPWGWSRATAPSSERENV